VGSDEADKDTDGTSMPRRAARAGSGGALTLNDGTSAGSDAANAGNDGCPLSSFRTREMMDVPLVPFLLNIQQRIAFCVPHYLATHPHPAMIPTRLALRSEQSQPVMLYGPVGPYNDRLCVKPRSHMPTAGQFRLAT
jgi:hypothetical protein